MIAAALNPFKYREQEAMAQYLKLGKKVAAGADFIVTQIGFDINKLGVDPPLRLESMG
jgi:methylenetetrahydrofolate reductase (NADPH)